MHERTEVHPESSDQLISDSPGALGHSLADVLVCPHAESQTGRSAILPSSTHRFQVVTTIKTAISWKITHVSTWFFFGFFYSESGCHSYL